MYLFRRALLRETGDRWHEARRHWDEGREILGSYQDAHGLESKRIEMLDACAQAGVPPVDGEGAV